MKHLNKYRMFFLSFVLGSVGCSTPNTELWPPKPEEATKEIYVSLDTWHAMIGFARGDIQVDDALNESGQTKPDGLQQPSFEEWGYAEREWYVEGHQGVIGVLRALFWPSDGVVEVAKYDQLWATRTPQPPSDLFTFQVSQQGYQQLRDHLRSTRASPNPVARGRGSRFYQSVNAYHLFHHCHHYVARALQEAGLPISVFWAFTRTGVASQLHQAEERQTMNNNGVNRK